MKACGRLLAILLLVPLHAATARQDWIFDLRTGVLYDSNVSRSDRSNDVEEDFAWRTLLSAGRGFQLTDDLRFSIFGEMEGEAWANYGGLSNLTPALSTNLRYRFGLGKSAPWLRFNGRFAYADFSEARRSGWDIEPGVSAGVSLAERIRLEAGYGFEHFAARDSVFAQDAHRFFVNGRIDLTTSLQLQIGYSYRHGDVTASAVPPRPDLVAIADLRILIDTFDEPYMAYRFSASTHTASIGLSQALSESIAVQASYEYQYTTHDPIDYVNHVAELSLAFSF